MEDVVNNIAYSYSGLSTYHTCPHAWYLTYIERAERSANYWAEFGTLVHLVLEKYFRCELEIYELADYFKDHYEECVVTPLPAFLLRKSPEYYDAAVSFFEQLDFDRDLYEVLVIEDKIEDVLEGNIKIVVKPDLVLKSKETGDVILVDYKSSNVVKPNGKLDQKKVESYMKQVRMYATFLHREGITVNKIRIWFIKANQWVERDFSAGDTQDIYNWITGTVAEIRDEWAWIGNTSNTFFCDNLCSVSKACQYR